MFYVTARDGKRTAFLLGPFDSRTEAELWVDAGRKMACDKSPAAWFYLYGTAHARGRDVDGVLNHLMPFCSWNAGGDPASGCDEWATQNDLCAKHLVAAELV